jgi:hypothetical protein
MDADPACPSLHSDDIIVCSNNKCAFCAYGNQVAKLMATRGINATCPACQGRATVGGIGLTPCPRCHGRGYKPKAVKAATCA